MQGDWNNFAPTIGIAYSPKNMTGFLGKIFDTQGSVSPFSPAGGALSSNTNTAIAGRFLNPNTPAIDGGGRVIRYNVRFIF